MGIQYIATVTDSGIIDEDVHSSVTFQNLLCSSVHCVCVSEVEDHISGRVSLVVEQNTAVKLSSCFTSFYNNDNTSYT